MTTGTMLYFRTLIRLKSRGHQGRVYKPDETVRDRGVGNFGRALADLSGQWIDRAHAATPLKWIVLGVDSIVSQLERCALRPGNVHNH